MPEWHPALQRASVPSWQLGTAGLPQFMKARVSNSAVPGKGQQNILETLVRGEGCLTDIVEGGTILGSDVGCLHDDAELNKGSKNFDSKGTHE